MLCNSTFNARYCVISLAVLSFFGAQSDDPDVIVTQGDKHDCKNTTCSLGTSSNRSSTTKSPPVNRGDWPRGRDPYERDGRYWLVPPFLIGASSVIVVYIIMHCFYLHCYTKRQMKKLARKVPPAIILSDSEHLSDSSMAPITPMVKYEGAYGKTELVEAQPFLFFHPEDIGEDRKGSVSQEARPSRRKSSIMQHLQLPNMFRRPSRQRPSVCSAGSVMETPSNVSSDQESSDDMLRPGRHTRASICFVPVGRTISDPSGNRSEWTPLQGFVYSSVLLARNPSYQMACGSSIDQNIRIGSRDGMSSNPSQSGLAVRKTSQTSEGGTSKQEQQSQRDTVVTFEIDPDINMEDAVFEEVKETDEPSCP